MALLHYTGKNVFGVFYEGGECVRLLPGITEVEDTIFDKIKSHPIFKYFVDIEKIRIMLNSVQHDGKTPVSEMIKNIPQIFDTRLLRKIISSDGRDNVIDLAKDQLDKIKNPARYKEKQNDNEHFS